MHVNVKLYSIFRLEHSDYDVEEGLKVNLEDESTIMDLLIALGIEQQRVAMVNLNGKITRDKSVALKEGDVVQVFPFFGGG